MHKLSGVRTEGPLSFQQIEEWILGVEGTAYFQAYKHPQDLPYEEFFISFGELKDQFATMSSAIHSCETTRAKNRSLIDLFRISKHYYPNITFVEVLRTLKKFVDVHKVDGIWCSDINRVIVTPHRDSSGYYSMSNWCLEGYPITKDGHIYTANEFGWKGLNAMFASLS